MKYRLLCILLLGTLGIGLFAITAVISYWLGVKSIHSEFEETGLLPDENKWTQTIQLPKGDFEGMSVYLDIRRKQGPQNFSPDHISADGADEIMTNSGIRIQALNESYDVAFQIIDTHFYSGSNSSGYQIAGGLRSNGTLSTLHWKPDFIIGAPSHSSRGGRIWQPNNEMRIARFTRSKTVNGERIDYVYDIVLAIRQSVPLRIERDSLSDAKN